MLSKLEGYVYVNNDDSTGTRPIAIAGMGLYGSKSEMSYILFGRNAFVELSGTNIINNITDILITTISARSRF